MKKFNDKRNIVGSLIKEYREKKHYSKMELSRKLELLGIELDRFELYKIETCKKQFGADFENFKTPMLYYPEDGDVVLSGEIGSLNNAKFQFRLKDPTGEGCFIWTEPIQLTETNINQLKIVYGVFKNWKTDLETAEDKKPMGMQGQKVQANNQEEQETQEQQQPKPQLTPGDDY